MATIKFESEEQFQSLLDNLARELVDASIHWKLRQDLTAQIKSFTTEFNQSTAFWSLTFQAHLDAAIFRLIRIYDGHSKALSLRNLLDTIASNLTVFDDERFRERLKENPFVESLAADARRPDEDQLRADMAYAGVENETVRKLTIWRNTLFAHKSAKNVVESFDISAEYPLTEEEVSSLLSDGIVILNRYSSMFGATTHSTQMVGHDDFMYVLECLQKDLQTRRRAFEDQSKASDPNT